MIHPPFNTWADDALGKHDAVDLQALLQAKKVSSVELTQAALARLDKAAPLNAVAERCDAKALEWAKQSDALRAKGKATGFRGLPVLLKDNLDFAGYPTRHGSLATPNKAAKKSAGIATQMQEAGLNIIAKTRLPEFGLTASTEYGALAPTRNPHNLDHSAGGSSGGSAALVAAGVVPIAHANDGGGSIRIPASCCGLIGFKPTRGRLRPNEMAASLPVQIVSDGVVTRTVRDTVAFFLEAERVYRNPMLRSFETAYGTSDSLPKALSSRLPVNRLRIGFFTVRATGEPVHPACVEGVLKVAKVLEDLGHRVEPMPIPVDEQFAEDFLLYWGFVAASVKFGGKLLMNWRFDPSQLEPLTHHLASHFVSHIRQFPKVLTRLKQFEHQYHDFFTDVDVLLSATVGTPPPALGHLDLNLPFEEARKRLFDFACYTAAQNVSGAPAISLPLHSHDGLPVGIHLATRKNEDVLLLDLARELEDAMLR